MSSPTRGFGSEHMLRVLGAMAEILTQHPVDDMGRCAACRHHGVFLRARHRTPCVIHDAFSLFLKGWSRLRA